MNTTESVSEVEGSDRITLTLTASEAVVLFEWLSRVSASAAPLPIDDKAEQVALWNLEAVLESVLVSPLRSDYGRLLAQARSRVREAE